MLSVNSQSCVFPIFGAMPVESISATMREVEAEDLNAYSSNPFAVREFKRYLIVRLVLGCDQMSMASPEVDAMWHQFILDTKKYRSFCNRVFGEYLDHTPGSFPQNPEFWVKYRELFGESPIDMWRNAANYESDCA